MNPNNNHFSIFSQLIRIRFLHSSASLSSVPPLPTSGTCSSSSFTVDFLVNSCGLSSKSALSVSNKFQIDEKKKKTPQKLQSVLELLKSHNFSDTQVARLIVKFPRVLNCRIHDNLTPKFEYLAKIGFEGDLLPHIILSNPSIIMNASLASRIKPSVQFLRLFLDNDEKFLDVLKRASWLLSTNCKFLLQQTADVLMKEGVPAYDVKRLLILQPRCIFQNPDKLITALKSVKSLGFEPTDTMFIQALRVMIQMSELTWKRKIEVMKSMGFSEEDTLTAFKGFPPLLGLSEENIRKTLHFYFDTMKLEHQTIIVNPSLLGYSIEKRVRPRYHVLKVLESKKLIEVTKGIYHMQIGEKNFREKFIDQFIDEVPGLLEFYLAIKEGKTSVLGGEEVSRCEVIQSVKDLITGDGHSSIYVVWKHFFHWFSSVKHWLRTFSEVCYLLIK